MFSVPFALTALIATLVVGGALTVWLWWVRRRQLIVAGGIRTLAAMRWREFSRFVIEVLQAQGFEATRIEPGNHQAPDADLRLTRDGQTWLLNCKQGANSRITTAMVDELLRTVRIASADGGILATLGRIEPDARRDNKGIELLDGATLWPLIDPLLPPSLHQDLAQQARKETIRSTGLAWLVALAFGLVLAMLLAPWVGGDGEEAPPAAPTTRTVAPPKPTPVTPAQPDSGTQAVASEEQMREAVVESVSTLPDVKAANWSTRSTLLVLLERDADDPLIDSICAVLERHPPLAVSRLQLQPPPGSQARVRFTQCSPY